MTELLFQRLHEDAVVPERAYAGDAGLDLVACEGAEIGPGERLSSVPDWLLRSPRGTPASSSRVPGWRPITALPC